MKVRVTNIQRFSLHDGPGIRTTIFLKGCSIRCPWCSNPENINRNIEKYYDKDRKMNGFFGYDIDLKKLEQEIYKDKPFYEINNGGVTFTGGEALLFFDKLEPLLKKLKKDKINICLETSLFAPLENLKIAVKYVDEFFVDIKILNKNLCNKILSGNVDIYYKNIDYLFDHINKEKIIFRIPVTKEYTFNVDNKKELFKFLDTYKSSKIEIFKIHNLGNKKYILLNKDVPKFENISDLELNSFLEEIKKYNKKVEVLNI